MNPEVKLFRSAAAEEAASLLMQQRSLPKTNKNKCFLCQTTNINHSDFLSSPKYLEQLKLFKKLIFSPFFRKSLDHTLTSKSKQFDYNNNKSCAFCLLTVNKIWDLEQRVKTIQREIDVVIQKTQEAIRKSLTGKDTKETRALLESVRDEKLDAHKADDEDVDLTAQDDDTSEPQEGDGVREENWFEADQDINIDFGIKSEVVVSEDEDNIGICKLVLVQSGEQVTRSTRNSKPKSNKAVSRRLVKPQPVGKMGIESDPEYNSESDENGSTQDEPESKAPIIHKCLHANCEMIFDKRALLRQHFKSVHNGVYHCPDCSAKFPKNGFLTRHKNRVHLKLKNFNCEYCPSKFFNKTEYSHHVRTHTGVRPYKCDKCGNSYNTMHYLNVHTKGYCKQGDLDEEFKQKLKEKGARKRKAYPRKYDVNYGKEIVVCDICGKSLQRGQLLDHTKRIHQQIKKHICPESGCQKQFYRKAEWQRHVIHVHKIELPNAKVQCDQCGLEFPHKDDLIFHKRKVHRYQENRFKCDLCPLTFWTQSELKKHFVRHSKGKEIEKPFKCSDCGIGFTNSKNLRVHKSRPSGRCQSRKTTVEKNCDVGKETEVTEEVEVESQIEVIEVEYVEIVHQ